MIRDFSSCRMAVCHNGVCVSTCLPSTNDAQILEYPSRDSSIRVQFVDDWPDMEQQILHVRDNAQLEKALPRHAEMLISPSSWHIMGSGRTKPQPNYPVGRITVPTVLRVERYRLSFFSNERQEPPHIHVRSGNDEAKFWIDPIALASNYGFSVRDLNEIEAIIERHHMELLEAWHEHFG